jgi:hypothetical protein
MKTRSRSTSCWWGRWLWTQNPFYAVSAALVLWGIRLSAPIELSVDHVATLWGMATAYLAMVAASTVLVIRAWRVWSDARTLLVLVPSLGWSLSMLFDEFLQQSPTQGAAFLFASFITASVLLESVLAWTRVRVAWSVRVVFYLLTVVLFSYPLALHTLSTQSNNERSVVWGLSLYPLVMCGLFLLLVPTIPHAKSLHASSGTPYVFPLFPYSLFAVLLLVAAFRFYLLALAFGPGWNYALLGPTHFVPFVLTAGVLVIEWSGSIGVDRWQRWALVAGPAAWVLTAMSSPVPGKEEVMAASPALVAGACFVFFGWCAIRRVMHADWGVLASLGVLGWVSESAVVSGRWPTVWFVGSVLLLGWGWYYRSGGRWWLAGAAMGQAGAVSLGIADWTIQVIIAANVACLGVIGFDHFFRRGWLSAWRDPALLGLATVFSYAALTHFVPLPTERWWPGVVYAAMLAAFLVVYARRSRNEIATVSACVVILVSALVAMQVPMKFLSTSFLRRGLLVLGLGLASLLAGLAVSYRKSRVKLALQPNELRVR